MPPLLEDHWQKSLLMSCDFGQILGCDKEMGRLVWQVIWAAVAASTVQGDSVDAMCRVHDFGSSSASDSVLDITIVIIPIDGGVFFSRRRDLFCRPPGRQLHRCSRHGRAWREHGHLRVHAHEGS